MGFLLISWCFCNWPSWTGPFGRPQSVVGVLNREIVVKNSRISAAEMFQVAKLQIWWELFPASFELLGAQVHEVSLDSLLGHLVICWLYQQYFFIYIFLRVSYITRTMTQSYPSRLPCSCLVQEKSGCPDWRRVQGGPESPSFPCIPRLTVAPLPSNH